MYLLLTLRFGVSSTGLITQRSLNNSWLIFLGGLLGSVFGIMGSIATLMGVVERVAKTVGKIVEEKRRIQEGNRKRNLLEACFGRHGAFREVEGENTQIKEDTARVREMKDKRVMPVAFEDY